jgi:hypothetical protein
MKKLMSSCNSLASVICLPCWTSSCTIAASCQRDCRESSSQLLQALLTHSWLASKKTAKPRQPQKGCVHSFSSHVSGVTPHMALHFIQTQLSHTARFHACVVPPCWKGAIPNPTNPTSTQTNLQQPCALHRCLTATHVSGLSKSTMLNQSAEVQSICVGGETA